MILIVKEKILLHWSFLILIPYASQKGHGPLTNVNDTNILWDSKLVHLHVFDSSINTYLTHKHCPNCTSLTYEPSLCQPTFVAVHRIAPKSMPVGPSSVTGLPTLVGFTQFGTQMEVLCTVRECGHTVGSETCTGCFTNRYTSLVSVAKYQGQKEWQ